MDQGSGAWTILASRMKTGREQRVPLCGRALNRRLRKHAIATVPHGFRSSFQDSAAVGTAHSGEVVEAALAHVVQNNVEAAYMRTDLFERRCRLMADWS